MPARLENDPTRPSGWTSIGLLCAPFALILLAHSLRAASGPFWNSPDPEYQYLFSSLNIARLHTPVHVDHPGMPPQEIAAVVIHLASIFRGHVRGFAQDVFAHAEIYLAWISGAMVLIQALTLALLGNSILKRTGRLSTAIVFQVFPMLSPALVFFFDRFTSEQMLIVFSYISAWAVFCWSFELIERRKLLLYSAVVTGLGMATKITFFPLAMVPLIFLRGFKEIRRYILLSIATFVLVTLPMLKRMPYFSHWMWDLLSHKGHYGSGGVGLIDTSAVGSRISMLAHGNAGYWAAWIIVLGATLLLFLKKERTSVFKGLIAVAIGSALQLLMVLKHFDAHYLIPGIVLLSAGVAIAFHEMLQRLKMPVLDQALAAVLVFTLMAPAWAQTREEGRSLEEYAQLDVKAGQIARASGCKYRVSYLAGQAYALYFGTTCGEVTDGAAIRQIFPDDYPYFPWSGPIPLRGIPLRPGDCLIYEGNPVSGPVVWPNPEFKPLTDPSAAIVVYEARFESRKSSAATWPTKRVLPTR